MIDDFNRENAALKSQEKDLLDKIDRENQLLKGVEGELLRTSLEIDRLKEGCAHFLIFEYLLRDFLRVSSPDRPARTDG